MIVPAATYRLQFRNGMTFDRAAALSPYLARLGITHLYASPLFAARPGSNHGYDGIDFAAIEPEIGGEDGFDRLGAALDSAGLGLLLDFVPNHMAAAEENLWWRSVLEWGAASPEAGLFDIDWSAPKLNLPILGTAYEEALREGVFGIAFDPSAGRFDFTLYDRRLPLTPASYGTLLGRSQDPTLAEFGRQFAEATVTGAADVKRRLAAYAAEPQRAAALSDVAESLSDDPATLHALHEAQVWRLLHWRHAREAMTYRRFFEIADLVCLRVEDPDAFDRVHKRLCELIASGRVSGLRLDHIDGLAEPRTYLERLRRAVGKDRPFYVVVEKILEGEEKLRADWPVAGTTGYEFISALADLFVDPRGEAAATEAYRAFTGTLPGDDLSAHAAKREILTYNLAAELETLTARARKLAAQNPTARHLDAATLSRAIVELAAAMPVYRTYVGQSGPGDIDRSLIAAAAADAVRACGKEIAPAIDFIAGVLTLDAVAPRERDAALGFTVRFQQTTGPVMAKAVEDTLFYRFNRLIALNEVGGSPERFGAPLAAFHDAMADRRETRPEGLSATSTHDTKRGEDARARLYALSEMPETWRQAVDRWRRTSAPHRTELPSGAAPDPATEWMFYQSLAGAWPADVSLDDLVKTDGPELDGLRTRMRAYMEKAIREAKTRTSWLDPDESYEAAVARFVDALLSRDGGREFLSDFAATCRPLWVTGALNGLSQLAVKLAAPGVPDIYQGTEIWDFSLVDPDNRRTVDFDRRRDMLQAVADPAALLDRWESGMPKMALTAAGLRARNDSPALFSAGEYLALSAIGHRADHIITFARRLDHAIAVLIAPRLAMDLLRDTDRPIVARERWGDTAVQLPGDARGRPLRDIVTGRTHAGATRINAADALLDFPVAILVSEP